VRKILAILISAVFFYLTPPQSPITGGGHVVGPGMILGTPSSPPPAATFEVNGTPTTDQTTINFQNSTAFNGLTFGFTNPSAGNVKATVTGTPTFAGGSTTQFQYNSSGALAGASGFTWNGTEPVYARGTITTDINPFPVSWTTNAGGVTFNGLKWVVTNTAQAAGSQNYQFCGGTTGTNCVQIDPFGNVKIPGTLTIGNGSVAGNWNFTQGTLPSISANSWQLTAPTSVPTAFQWVGPSAAAGGIVALNASGATATLSSSGDTKHSKSGSGLSASVGLSTLCAAADCPAGVYMITFRIRATSTCATPGPSEAHLTLTFTDDGGAESGVGVALIGNGSTTVASGLALGVATNYSYAVPPQIGTTGVQPIQYAIPYTACTSGTGTYSYSVEVIPLQ
jgi:hypothetical protein